VHQVGFVRCKQIIRLRSYVKFHQQSKRFGLYAKLFLSLKANKFCCLFTGGINREYIVEAIVRPSISLSGDFECLFLFNFIEM
jgi:hypothetical protein